METITGYEAGFIVIAVTVILCCFILMFLAMIQEDWVIKILKYTFLSGTILGLLTLLITLYSNVIWCSC